ncbi:MAG: AbrB/MazE/SpoVT family DNA-binding domain-containing protein [Acidobacteria bacterium]|nr:AbrB/MazE/SpoVT family DNA-binding domain-containing protein [Acidobacteriota bacterium]
MSKVTSKLQVTIPKVVAERYGIRPGDEITWEPAGEVIRVVPPRPPSPRLSLEERLRLFDEATERQRAREAGRPPMGRVTERGWRAGGPLYPWQPSLTTNVLVYRYDFRYPDKQRIAERFRRSRKLTKLGSWITIAAKRQGHATRKPYPKPSRRDPPKAVS